MIQRIQTIYLLIAAILMAVTAFSPILSLNEGMTLFSYGIKQANEVIKPTWGIVSMAGLSALLSFITIFMFKNRKKQAKMVLISALIVVFYFVTAVVYLASYLNKFTEGINTVMYGIIFPIIALVLLLLAFKGINKDEKLVRSLDRIR